MIHRFQGRPPGSLHVKPFRELEADGLQWWRKRMLFLQVFLLFILFRRLLVVFFTDHAKNEREHLPRFDTEHMGKFVVQAFLRILHQPLVRR